MKLQDVYKGRRRRRDSRTSRLSNLFYVLLRSGGEEVDDSRCRGRVKPKQRGGGETASSCDRANSTV